MNIGLLNDFYKTRNSIAIFRAIQFTYFLHFFFAYTHPKIQTRINDNHFRRIYLLLIF